MMIRQVYFSQFHIRLYELVITETTHAEWKKIMKSSSTRHRTVFQSKKTNPSTMRKPVSHAPCFDQFIKRASVIVPSNKLDDVIENQPEIVPMPCLTIIDWDDTLNPSHWCVSNGALVTGSSLSSEMIRLPSGDQLSTLKCLSQAAAKTISICLELGNVAIVTNAESGWVEISSRVLLPEVHAYVFSLLGICVW